MNKELQGLFCHPIACVIGKYLRVTIVQDNFQLAK